MLILLAEGKLVQILLLRKILLLLLHFEVVEGYWIRAGILAAVDWGQHVWDVLGGGESVGILVEQQRWCWITTERGLRPVELGHHVPRVVLVASHVGHGLILLLPQRGLISLQQLHEGPLVECIVGLVGSG